MEHEDDEVTASPTAQPDVPDHIVPLWAFLLMVAAVTVYLVWRPRRKRLKPVWRRRMVINGRAIDQNMRGDAAQRY